MRTRFLTALSFSSCLPLTFSAVLAQAQSVAAPLLEEVVVVASGVKTPLRQVGASVSTISQDEIQQRGYTQLADVLRTQPSISVSNSGGLGKQTAIRIRGEESYRTTILIDGINIADPTGVQAAPISGSLALSSDIQKIEILRGPQGFIYGADSGGVISINTLSDVDTLSAGVSGEVGTHHTRTVNAYVANGSDAGEFYVSAFNQQTDGFNARVSDVDGEDDGNSNTTLHVKLKANINDAAYAQLVVRDINNNTQFDSCFTATPNDCLGKNDTTVARASLGFTGDTVNQTVSYAHTSIERENSSNGVVSFNPKGTLDEVMYVGDIQINEQLSVVAGFDVEQHSIQNELSNAPKQERDQQGVFVELQSTPLQDVTLTAGIRHDNNEDFGEHTSGRISGAFLQQIESQTQVKYRASVGNGFRAPSLSEIAYNNSRRDAGQVIDFELQEEKTQGIDVGFDIFTQKSSIGVTYFYQEVDNFIGFNFESGEVNNYFQDEGISTSKGVEFNARHQFVPQFALSYNATINKTAQIDGSQRVRRPTHLSNLLAEFNLLDNKLNVLANLRAARDAIDVGGVPLDNYLLLDISATYTLNEQTELFGRVNNAGDVNYVEVNGFNTPGSAVFIGARFTL